VRALALIFALLASGCGATSSELVLAGDGELWWVDVEAERAVHVRAPELGPGDPPERVVRRGDRFVFIGDDLYAAASGEPLERLTDDAWFFIPSAHPDRVWATVLDPRSPATANALQAVREVAVDGRVTVADVKPPRGRWPLASVWDPRTRRETSLDLGAVVGPAHGDTIASCAADPCRELWLTDAGTGRRRVAPAPDGAAFHLWAAAFAPDGVRLAVPVNGSGSPTEPAALALVDTRSLEAEAVPGSTVPPGYVLTAWASDEVFITGGERFEPRTILAYRRGDERARTLDVDVGDFYDVAAG
jgi:hypothetical protein